MDKFTLIFEIFLIATSFAQNVDFSGPLVHNETIIIYCNYSAPKGAGRSKWSLDTTQYTDLCDLTIDDGTLQENPEKCDGDADPTSGGSFAFNLTLDYNRDRTLWNCALASTVYLDLSNMIVPLKDVSTESDVGNEINTDETIQIKAITGCCYPVPDLHWCLKTNSTHACSDDSAEYWTAFFYDEPVIDTNNQTCSEFDGSDVKFIVSDFVAVNPKFTGNINIYPVVGGVEYEGKTFQINVSPGGMSAGEIAGIVIGVLALIAITTVLVVVVVKKQKRQNTS